MYYSDIKCKQNQNYTTQLQNYKTWLFYPISIQKQSTINTVIWILETDDSVCVILLPKIVVERLDY